MRNPFPFIFLLLLSSCTSTYTSVPKSKLSESTVSRKGEEDVSEFFISDKIYGPFHPKYGDPEVKVTFRYRFDIPSQRIYERLYLSPINNQSDGYFYKSKGASYYSNMSIKEVSFDVPISKYLSDKGLLVSVEVINYGTNTPVRAYKARIFPVYDPGWDYNDLTKEFLGTKSLGFYADGTGLKEVDEGFDFYQIGEHIENENYYRLDISNNRAFYFSKFKLTYDSIYLHFYDRDNLFPYFTHNSNDKIVIPLEAKVIDEKEVLFYFKNSFYVNKKTLDMSDTPRSGFEMTKDFYMPLNAYEKLNHVAMGLTFVNYGKIGLNFTYPLRYFAGEPMVGTVGNAKFYVVGGSK